MFVLLVHVNQHHFSKEDRFPPIKINANYGNSGLCWVNLFQEEGVEGARTVLELSVNELAGWAGRVETAALIFPRCLPASPMLRACGRELCWNLAVQKHSPEMFWCQLQRLAGGTDGTFPGNYNIMLFPIRSPGESWLGDLINQTIMLAGEETLVEQTLTTGTRFPVKAEILT